MYHLQCKQLFNYVLLFYLLCWDFRWTFPLIFASLSISRECSDMYPLQETSFTVNYGDQCTCTAEKNDYFCGHPRLFEKLCYFLVEIFFGKNWKPWGSLVALGVKAPTNSKQQHNSLSPYFLSTQKCQKNNDSRSISTWECASRISLHTLTVYL